MLFIIIRIISEQIQMDPRTNAILTVLCVGAFGGGSLFGGIGAIIRGQERSNGYDFLAGAVVGAVLIAKTKKTELRYNRPFYESEPKVLEGPENPTEE
jgi:hypothetical protein